MKTKEYKLRLFFLWIPDSQLAIARIKDRVADGGHHVATEDVKRRFNRSINNFFKLYMPLLDKWMLFNNSGVKPSLIAKKNNGGVEIINKELFKKILRKAGVNI